MLALLLIAAPPAPWVELAEQDGVVVETKKLGSGSLVRGRTTLPYPVSEVTAVLRDLEGFSRWIPNLSTWKVTDKTAAEAFVYARHDLSWPMDDRDYCVRYTWKERGDGGFVLRAKATTEKGPAPIDGVIRLSRVQSEWIAEASGSDATSVTYTYYGDLGGSVPKAVELEAWKSEPPRLFKALTAELLARRRR